MPKYTNGPWSINPNGDGTSMIGAPGGADVADTRASADEKGNARLIAAAPDLLNSLKEMVAHLLKHAALGLSDEEVSMLRRAEAAIARS